MASKFPKPGSTSLAIGIGVLFALAARLPYFLGSDFPLNDGGMFLAMSRDILSSSFALPYVTSYNGESIPFAYPPLSFYLVALTSRATGLDPIGAVRFIPLLANLITVAGVAVLARSWLGPGWAAFLAPTIFALIPRSYEWMIMGGGLTRSVGFMFAIACLARAKELYAQPTVGKALVCGILAAAALASHLELGIFTIYSLLLMALVGSRSFRALLLAYALALLAAVLTAPWWVTVIGRHGMAPFSAASLTSEWTPLDQSIAAFEHYAFAPGLVFVALGGLALLGAVALVIRGELFLPIWLPAIFIWVPRSAQTEAAVPLALLAAVGMAEVVGPGLLSAAGRDGPSSLSRFAGSLARPLPPHLVAGWRALYALGFLLLLAAVFIYSPRMHPDPTALGELSAGDRQAMTWVADNTPVSAQFLVLTTASGWESDRVAEWFPVVAGRGSLLTPQGSEWLPDGAFGRKLCLYNGVRSFSGDAGDVGELEKWAQSRGISFSHIYLSKEVRSTLDWTELLASARTSSNYKVVVDNSAAVVLERSEPLPGLWGPAEEMLVCRDCQVFADQPQSIQMEYIAAHGVEAAWAWVQDHDRALAKPATLCDQFDTLGLGQIGLVDSVCRDRSTAGSSLGE